MLVNGGCERILKGNAQHLAYHNSFTPPPSPPDPPLPSSFHLYAGIELTVQSLYRALQQHLHAPPQPCPASLPSPLSTIGRAASLLVASADAAAHLFQSIIEHTSLSPTQGLVCLAGHPLAHNSKTPCNIADSIFSNAQFLLQL